MSFEAIDDLFDLILYVPSTIFELNRDGSSWVEPVLSWDKSVLLKDHNAVTPVKLVPVALRSRAKHSTTEPLHSLKQLLTSMDHNSRPRAFGSSELKVCIFKYNYIYCWSPKQS